MGRPGAEGQILWMRQGRRCQALFSVLADLDVFQSTARNARSIPKVGRGHSPSGLTHPQRGNARVFLPWSVRRSTAAQSLAQSEPRAESRHDSRAGRAGQFPGLLLRAGSLPESRQWPARKRRGLVAAWSRRESHHGSIGPPITAARERWRPVEFEAAHPHSGIPSNAPRPHGLPVG